MTHAARLAREDAITEALRAADAAIGQEEPTTQAMRIIDAIKRLRAGAPARVTATERVDYLRIAQEAARSAWTAQNDEAQAMRDRGEDFEIDASTSAHVATPLGSLRAVVWRVHWRGGRMAWASEYTLDDEPITIAEIKAAGLAQRPTTRRRQKAEPTIVGDIDRSPSKHWKNR